MWFSYLLTLLKIVLLKIVLLVVIDWWLSASCMQSAYWAYDDSATRKNAIGLPSNDRLLVSRPIYGDMAYVPASGAIAIGLLMLVVS